MSSKAPVQPGSVRIEASTHCQLRCPCCPNAKGVIRTLAAADTTQHANAQEQCANVWLTYARYQNTKRLKPVGLGHCTFERFAQIVDGNPWIRRIELSNWGEMFLNPELPLIVEYAHRKNVVLTADNGCNLNTADDKALEALAKYKFRSIVCSIDGASSQTYAAYRIGGNFDRVISTIKKINMFKTRYKTKLPILNWQFIPFDHNVHEIEDARKLAKDLHMNFFIKLSVDGSWATVKNSDMVRRQTRAHVSTQEEYVQRYGLAPRQKLICAQLWLAPQINWDGRLLGCCVNYWDDFGDVVAEGLLPALNNEKIGYARQMLLGKVDAREDVPCTRCRYYELMKRSGRWLSMPAISSYALAGRMKDAWISLFGTFPLPRRFWV